MICPVCNSEDLFIVKYDRHKRSFQIKSILKRFLQLLDFLIPKDFHRLKKITSKTKSPFRGDIRVCCNCGYGVMNTPPSEEELKDYYSKQYWSGRLDKTKKASFFEKDYGKDPRAKIQIEFSLEKIDKERIGKILEIGAGSAFASLLLRDKCNEAHLELDVCEPGAIWEEYYKEKEINKIADYFPFKTSKKYDYIHTSHWLEHVLDLKDTIRALNAICEKGGFIFVEIPNSAHKYWHLPLKDTPHIHFFTMTCLKKIFEESGFKCLDIKECGISYLEWFHGEVLTPDKYGEKEKGFHIRAIFEKV